MSSRPRPRPRLVYLHRAGQLMTGQVYGIVLPGTITEMCSKATKLFGVKIVSCQRFLDLDWLHRDGKLDLVKTEERISCYAIEDLRRLSSSEEFYRLGKDEDGGCCSGFFASFRLALNRSLVKNYLRSHKLPK